MSLTTTEWITIGFSITNTLLAFAVFIYIWYTNKTKGPRISIVDYISRKMDSDEITINFRYVNSGDTKTILIFTGFIEFRDQAFESSVTKKEAISPVKEIQQNHVHFKNSLPQGGIVIDETILQIRGYYFDHNGKKKKLKQKPIQLNEIK